MHETAVLALEDQLLPAAERLIGVLRGLKERHEGVIKSGRAHQQDTVPITFSQEISGWQSSLERNCELIRPPSYRFRNWRWEGPLWEHGLNEPAGFGGLAEEKISLITGKAF